MESLIVDFNFFMLLPNFYFWNFRVSKVQDFPEISSFTKLLSLKSYKNLQDTSCT